MEQPISRDHEDDDHDLLTFDESRVRLQDEIATLEARIETEGEQDAASLAQRLDQLRGAMARIQATAEAKPGETGFLTYTPPTFS